MNLDLTMAQNEVYKRECMFNNTSINNNSTAIFINKKISYSLLNDCVNNVIEKLPIMRLKVCRTEGYAKQYFAEFKPSEYPYILMESDADYEKWVNEKLCECVFDYDSPLYRFYIIFIKKKQPFCYFFKYTSLADRCCGYISCK